MYTTVKCLHCANQVDVKNGVVLKHYYLEGVCPGSNTRERPFVFNNRRRQPAGKPKGTATR